LSFVFFFLLFPLSRNTTLSATRALNIPTKLHTMGKDVLKDIGMVKVKLRLSIKIQIGQGPLVDSNTQPFALATLR